MSAPNLKSPTTITGNTVAVNIGNTSENIIKANAASSGKAIRITSLFVSNVDGTNNADITIKYHTAASGGAAATMYPICTTLAVPADSTVVLLTREQSVWLTEDTRISATASAANDLTVVCSYEEVS